MKFWLALTMERESRRLQKRSLSSREEYIHALFFFFLFLFFFLFHFILIWYKNLFSIFWYDLVVFQARKFRLMGIVVVRDESPTAAKFVPGFLTKGLKLILFLLHLFFNWYY